jgi:hypothetical protein
MQVSFRSISVSSGGIPLPFLSYIDILTIASLQSLENARQIVYSNNQAMEEAIGNDIGFHYFIGCKQIGLNIHSGEDYFRNRLCFGTYTTGF